MPWMSRRRDPLRGSAGRPFGLIGPVGGGLGVGRRRLLLVGGLIVLIVLIRGRLTKLSEQLPLAANLEPPFRRRVETHQPLEDSMCRGRRTQPPLDSRQQEQSVRIVRRRL